MEQLHTIDAFWPGFPRTGSGADVVVDLDQELLDLKLAALACHGSQMRPVEAALGPSGFRRLASVEAYLAANEAARRQLIAGVTPEAARPRPRSPHPASHNQP